MESDGSKLPPVEQVAEQIRNIASGFKALQIDFDARQSQLEWYQSLLLDLEGSIEARNQFNLRAIGRVPEDLSITALASWCGAQPWIARIRPGLKEVVPMLFRMGPQRVALLNQLARQKEFAEDCRGSIGTSLDEPLPWYPAATRVYIFNPKRWTKEAFDQACARWR